MSDSRRARRVASLTAAALLALGLEGCADEDLPPPATFTPGEPVGDESDGIASLRSSTEAVDAAMLDAAQALRTDVETPQNGVRRLQTCGTAPVEAAQVDAYGRVVGEDAPLVGRLQAASDRLQMAGWTEAGSDLSGPDPAVGLTKGGAQLVLGGDVQPDGDAIGFFVRGPCYRYEGPLERLGVTRRLDFSS